MPRGVFEDLTGRVFGRLTATGYAGGGRWHCICSCGRATTPNASSLKRGRTRSCGSHQKPLGVTELDRLLLSQSDGCVDWTGSVCKVRGYGHHIVVDGLRMRPHQAALHKKIGPRPEGKEACHGCGNEICVRVGDGHLRWGTKTSNARDKVGHGTNGKTLRDVDVWAIRAGLAAGLLGVSLARMFGVNQHTISYIKTGKTWAHLT